MTFKVPASFEISKTFFYIRIYLKPHKMFVVDINTCIYRNARQRELENTRMQTRHSPCTSDSMDMRESNKRALGTNHTFCKHFENLIGCSPVHLFSLTLKLILVNMFRSCSTKIKNFQGQKPFSSTTAKIQGYSNIFKTLTMILGHERKS